MPLAVALLFAPCPCQLMHFQFLDKYFNQFVIRSSARILHSIHLSILPHSPLIRPSLARSARLPPPLPSRARMMLLHIIAGWLRYGTWPIQVLPLSSTVPSGVVDRSCSHIAFLPYNYRIHLKNPQLSIAYRTTPITVPSSFSRAPCALCSLAAAATRRRR